MKKNCLRSIWAFLILLPLLSMTALADTPTSGEAAELIAFGSFGETGSNLTWAVDENGLLTIGGTGSMGNAIWPWSDYKSNIHDVLIENGVTTVGRSAFRNYDLTRVTLPSTVRVIGMSAFEGCGIEQLVLPYGVETIEEYAFKQNVLGNLLLPDSLNTIEDGAFENCRLTRLVLPAGLLNYGSEVFMGCTQLTEIVFPDSMTHIWPSMFENCYGLTTLDLPTELVQIFDSAFKGCSSLTEVVLPDKVEAIGVSAFAECTALEQVVFSKNLRTISPEAFEYTALTSITLPEGLKDIGSSAFRDCDGLSEVRIPVGVTQIGSGAFADCHGLSGFIVDEENTTFSTVDGLLFSEDQTLLHSVPANIEGSYTVPAGVKTIGEEAFAACQTLEKVILPDSLETIGDSAFDFCVHLKDMVIPAGVTKIGKYAFSGCEDMLGIYFKGDAPQVFGAKASGRSFDTDVVLHYTPGSAGWTDSAAYDSASSVWNGYWLTAWDSPVPVVVRDARLVEYSSAIAVYAELRGNRMDLTAIVAFYKDGRQTDLFFRAVEASERLNLSVSPKEDFDSCQVFLVDGYMQPMAEMTALEREES